MCEAPRVNSLDGRDDCHYLFVNNSGNMRLGDLSANVNAGGHPEVTVPGRCALMMAFEVLHVM